MSTTAKSTRAAMKAKAARMGSKTSPGKVDASSWTPPEPLNTEIKTGMRPLSRRAFKKGGKVVEKCEGGPTAMRADRPQRKSGGGIGTAMVNRNVKTANEERPEGKAHVGGYKKGGEAKAVVKKAIRQHDKNMHGGKHEELKLRKGGRTRKADGGDVKYENWKDLRTNKGPAEGQGDRTSGPGGSQMPSSVTVIRGAKTTEEPTTTTIAPRNPKKKGGRAERKSGGRAKGKTNIVISINANKPDANAMPKMPMPTPPPMPVPPVAPPGVGGPPPMMPPPGGPPPGLAGPPPGAGGPPGMPPMPRKRGGRAYRSYKDMDAGSMSGEGRLEKSEIAARKGRLSGGRARSYKDMDAGSMSGMGRIEKTAIQKHK
jgi:hypothetical protein